LSDRRKRLVPTKIPSRAFGLPEFKCELVSSGAYHTIAMDFDGGVWINLKILS
jgi:hypothetical protein